MTHLLVITGDCNDADYITKITELNINDSYNKKVVEALPKIATAIKNCTNRHNWPTSEYSKTTVYELYKDILTEEEIDWISDCVPYGEYGIHTVDSIKLYEISKVTEIL